MPTSSIATIKQSQSNLMKTNKIKSSAFSIELNAQNKRSNIDSRKKCKKYRKLKRLGTDNKRNSNIGLTDVLIGISDNYVHLGICDAIECHFSFLILFL